MNQIRSRSGRSPGPTGAGRRIYDLLRAQIADGTLSQGGRMPSTRALAIELGVSRTTITAAYEQLVAEGFLVTSMGRAARVAAPLAASAPPTSHNTSRNRPPPLLSDFGRRIAGLTLPGPPPVEPVAIDFRYGAVASRDFPSLAWRRAYQAEMLHQPRSICYIAPEGDDALRRAVQGYLARARGLSCDAGQIVVVHGSQQAIDLCARLLLGPEDAFAFEDPGYLMARRCFEATGARLLPTPVDEHGLNTAHLPTDSRVRLAYVTPSHQFPLGGVLPVGRRMELLQWAQRHQAWIIEDDYDGEFRYGQRPIDALRSIDVDDRVIYIGTFSKTLSPQLRLGYLVLPADLVSVFRQTKQLADRHAPVLDQRVLASLIDSGVYERHVRRVRRENEQRRAVLLDAVARHLGANACITGTAAGLHAVLWLLGLSSEDEPALVAACRGEDVGVYPVSPLFAKPSSGPSTRPAGMIMGYAGLTQQEIERGIRILAAIVGQWRS